MAKLNTRLIHTVKVSDKISLIHYKATVKVRIDTSGIYNYLNRDSNGRSTIVQQNNSLQELIAENNKQVQDLRQRAMNASTDEERAAIRAEYQQVDNEFLAKQKIEEGNQLYYQGDYNGAIAKYTEALQLNSNLADAYNNRGAAYDDMGNHNAAINDFNKAIELNPNFADAYHNRAIAYVLSGKFDLALKDASKAIELNPNDGIAYQLRGMIYRDMGDNARAQADFDKAKQLGYSE